MLCRRPVLASWIRPTHVPRSICLKVYRPAHLLSPPLLLAWLSLTSTPTPAPTATLRRRRRFHHSPHWCRRFQQGRRLQHQVSCPRHRVPGPRRCRRSPTKRVVFKSTKRRSLRASRRQKMWTLWYRKMCSFDVANSKGPAVPQYLSRASRGSPGPTRTWFMSSAGRCGACVTQSA